ncbi:MAG: glycosyltransferase family 4 protein [Rhizobiaceae bacterium]|nr:glycosyltransferase family 4 protein [Rhizobiaceae bacterium]
MPTGGYRYDKRILQEWETLGLRYNLISLNGDFPFPDTQSIAEAVDAIDGFAAADISVVDGLAGGVMPQFIKKLASISPVVALIHHPLCLENGLPKSQAKSLEESERAGLEYVSGIVTTSPATTATVTSLFEHDPDRIKTVLPGVERGKIAHPYQSGPINLLCIGSLIERKGHHFLIEALTQLKHLDWKLDCYGMLDEQSDLYRQTMQQIDDHDLAERITFHGSVSDDQISQAYQESHIFVLPSLFEGYGMAYAEAIVHGLPVIGTNAGAIPDTVPPTCGLLAEPGDVSSLKRAIQTLLTNDEALAQYRHGAIEAEKHFPTWKTSAKKFMQILEQWS